MECEREWAQNKKLVELKGRDVRRGVPKGLPYFFVDFAMDAGFAHVIEDEQDFPNNFAQVGILLHTHTHTHIFFYSMQDLGVSYCTLLMKI